MLFCSTCPARCIIPWPKEDGDEATTTDRLTGNRQAVTPSAHYVNTSNAAASNSVRGSSNTLCRFHPRCLMCCGKFQSTDEFNREYSNATLLPFPSCNQLLNSSVTFVEYSTSLLPFVFTIPYLTWHFIPARLSFVGLNRLVKYRPTDTRFSFLQNVLPPPPCPKSFHVWRPCLLNQRVFVSYSI